MSVKKIEFSKHTPINERNEIKKIYNNDKTKNETQSKKCNKKQTVKLITMPYGEYLKTKYWQKVKYKVLKRDNFKCTKCGEREPLHVHHLTYKHKGSELKHLTDLITLCDLCHKLIHNK